MYGTPLEITQKEIVLNVILAMKHLNKVKIKTQEEKKNRLRGKSEKQNEI